MDLGLAGVISGAGEAGGKSLMMAQAQYGASSLQAQRDAMDDLRQQRLLDATAKQGELNRAATKEEKSADRTATAQNLQTQLTSSEGIHAADRTSADTRSKETLANAKAMNEATNATHLLVGKLQRQMQEKQFDKTFTQAKLTALKDTVRELGYEITRLSVVVGNPLADKGDPNYKAAVEQLAAATRLHNLYAQQVGIEMNIPSEKITGAIKGPELPPFKMPPVGGATRTPGMVETPMPSMDEMERMRAATQ